MDCAIFELEIQPCCPSPYKTSSGRTLFGYVGCIISTSSTLTCGSDKPSHMTAPSSSGCSKFDIKSDNPSILSSKMPNCWTVGLASCSVELTPRMTSSDHVVPRKCGNNPWKLYITDFLYGNLRTTRCERKISYRMNLTNLSIVSTDE